MRLLSLATTRKFLISFFINVTLLFCTGIAFSSSINISAYSLQTWNNCSSSYIAFDSREFIDNCYYYYNKSVSINLNEGDSIRLNVEVYQFIAGKNYDEHSLLNSSNVEEGKYCDLKNNEIAIPKNIATKYKINVGDDLVVSGNKLYSVKYIFRDFYDIKKPSIYSTGNVVFIGGDEKLSNEFVYAGFGTDTGVYNEIYTFGKAEKEFVKTIALNVFLISVISIITQIGIIIRFRKQELKNLYKDCVSGSKKNYLSSILGVNVIIHLIPAVIASIALLLMGNMIPSIVVFSTVLLAFGCKVLYLYLKVH